MLCWFMSIRFWGSEQVFRSMSGWLRKLYVTLISVFFGVFWCCSERGPSVCVLVYTLNAGLVLPGSILN